MDKLDNTSFGNWRKDPTLGNVFAFDNTEFTERYSSPDYFFLLEKEYKKRNFEKRRGNKFHSFSTLYYYSESKKSISIKEGKKLMKIVKLPRLETDSKITVRFQLQDAFEQRLFQIT